MSGSMNRYQRRLHIEQSERNLIRTGGPEREQFKYSNSEKRNTIFFTSTQFINDRPYWMAAIILSVSHRIATVRTEMFHKMVSQMLWCQIINYKTHWFTNYKVGCVFPMLVVLLTLLMTSKIDLWPLEMLRVGHVCKRNFKQVINRFFIPGKGKWTWNMENRTWNWTLKESMYKIILRLLILSWLCA